MPRIFAQITKVDEETRTVTGRAAQELPDRDQEVFHYESSKPNFMKWSAEVHADTDGKSLGNVRAMHGNVAAGILKDIDFLDDEKAIDICAEIVDDQEWKKILKGVYTGFSIGGKYLKKWPAAVNGKMVNYYTADPTEISIVDRPCGTTAKFYTVHKLDGSSEQRALRSYPTLSQLLKGGPGSGPHKGEGGDTAEQHEAKAAAYRQYQQAALKEAASHEKNGQSHLATSAHGVASEMDAKALHHEQAARELRSHTKFEKRRRAKKRNDKEIPLHDDDNHGEDVEKGGPGSGPHPGGGSKSKDTRSLGSRMAEAVAQRERQTGKPHTYVQDRFKTNRDRANKSREKPEDEDVEKDFSMPTSGTSGIADYDQEGAKPRVKKGGPGSGPRPGEGGNRRGHSAQGAMNYAEGLSTRAANAGFKARGETPGWQKSDGDEMGKSLAFEVDSVQSDDDLEKGEFKGNQHRKGGTVADKMRAANRLSVSAHQMTADARVSTDSAAHQTAADAHTKAAAAFQAAADHDDDDEYPEAQAAADQHTACAAYHLSRCDKSDDAEKVDDGDLAKGGPGSGPHPGGGSKSKDTRSLGSRMAEAVAQRERQTGKPHTYVQDRFKTNRDRANKSRNKKKSPKEGDVEKLEGATDLRKGIPEISQLAQYCYGLACMAGAENSERRREGDDSQIPEALRDAASNLLHLLAEMAEEEGDELGELIFNDDEIVSTLYPGVVTKVPNDIGKISKLMQGSVRKLDPLQKNFSKVLDAVTEIGALCKGVGIDSDHNILEIDDMNEEQLQKLISSSVTKAVKQAIGGTGTVGSEGSKRGAQVTSPTLPDDSTNADDAEVTSDQGQEEPTSDAKKGKKKGTNPFASRKMEMKEDDEDEDDDEEDDEDDEDEDEDEDEKGDKKGKKAMKAKKFTEADLRKAASIAARQALNALNKSGGNTLIPRQRPALFAAGKGGDLEKLQSPDELKKAVSPNPFSLNKMEKDEHGRVTGDADTATLIKALRSDPRYRLRPEEIPNSF